MRWLREGVSLDWRSQPPPPFDFGDSLAELTPNQDAFLRREVPRCLKTGAWVRATDRRFVSKAFLVDKPGVKT